MINESPDNMNLRLLAVTRAFAYPPTPDLGRAMRLQLHAPSRPATARRLAWALAVLALIVGGLLSVPEVRAAVAEILRIGVVTIFLGPTPTPTAVPTATPGATEAAAAITPVPTRTATPVFIASLLDMHGETTLAEAERLSGFTVRLPAYPADLSQPDKVFYQDQGGSVVVLVWVDPSQPGQVRMSLHMLSPDSWGVAKLEPVTVAETTVNGQRAVWTEGPYMMLYLNGTDTRSTRLVDGHVLIWTDGAITYRLETDVSLEEAVRIAESLE